MKRTTYILIGLFVAGLCVLVGGMFMIFCLGRPYISNQLNLQGEQITKEVPACRVVWLTQTRLYTPERNVWLANSLLEVQPSKEGKNLFSCSKKVNDYLKMTVMGDTLKILLDYSLDQLPQEFKKSKFMGMNIGGPAGDLYITFVIAEDPVFKRLGDDLYIDVEVDLYSAVLGGEKVVDTLDGKVKLKIKPETQNGTKVRLKGKGFPVYKKEGQFGDLIVTYSVKIPTNLTDKQKELFRQLQSMN